MAGFVYVMSNPAFSGLLKIGQTNRDPEAYRKEELDSTGVPAPFKVEFYVFADNYIELEYIVHRALSEYRPNTSKEFFDCSIPIAIEKIRELGGDNIKYEHLNYVFPPKPKKRKPKPKPKPTPKPKLIGRRREGETLKDFDARMKRENLEAIKKAKAKRKGKKYINPKKRKTYNKTQHIDIKAKDSDNDNWAGYGLLVVAAIAIYYFLS